MNTQSNLLRTLIDDMHVGVLVVDSGGSIIMVNPAALALLGLSDMQVLGMSMDDAHWDIIREDGRPFPAVERPSTRAAVTGESVQNVVLGVYRPATRDRVWLLVNATPHHGRDGSIQQIITTFIDITERKAFEEQLRYQALHDSLTDLPNRTLLHDRLQQAILSARRDGSSLALLLLDLDHFKEVNDTCGHHVGDLLLQRLSSRLCGALRESDTVARLGGDEFAALLPLTDEVRAAAVAPKILRTLERPFVLDGQTFEIAGSIGIALYPQHGEDPHSLLRRADVAMYVAKRTDGGYAFYETEQDHHSPRRLAMISDLRQAIDANQLLLHYQPEANLLARRVTDVEALVRWQHPLHGLVPPDQFIPLAERTRLIRPLTLWALNEALRQSRIWHEGGLNLRIHVNFSARSLHDDQLVEGIARLLELWRTNPSDLGIELTESAVAADPDQAFRTLARLHDMGIHISIDDFGKGYSSLAYLKDLPIDAIKIDRSFIKDVIHTEADSRIVRGIVSLAHDIGLRAVAEGIEDRETWNHLTRLGCDLAQGDYLSPPLPICELDRWLCQANVQSSSIAL